MKYVNYKITLYNDPNSIEMNTQQPIEDRLWDYIDGRSNPAERSAIEELLATNREWQEKHRELLSIQQLLSSTELEAPSMRFTKNVMDEIARYHVAPATSSYVNKNVIRGIGAFFLTMIIGVLAYVFAQFKWTSGSGDNSSFNIPVDKLGLDRLNNTPKAFTSVNITIFMLITTVAGLMLLDRYLQRRKKQQIHA